MVRDQGLLRQAVQTLEIDAHSGQGGFELSARDLPSGESSDDGLLRVWAGMQAGALQMLRCLTGWVANELVLGRPTAGNHWQGQAVTQLVDTGEAILRPWASFDSALHLRGDLGGRNVEAGLFDLYVRPSDCQPWDSPFVVRDYNPEWESELNALRQGVASAAGSIVQTLLDDPGLEVRCTLPVRWGEYLDVEAYRFRLAVV